MHTINIPYQHKGIELEGFVAFPSDEKRHVVILCHAWKGKDDFIMVSGCMADHRPHNPLVLGSSPSCPTLFHYL